MNYVLTPKTWWLSFDYRQAEWDDIDNGILQAKDHVDNDDIAYDDAFIEVKIELVKKKLQSNKVKAMNLDTTCDIRQIFILLTFS